jgi:Spy/CpxP family protein refolding chaperone
MKTKQKIVTGILMTILFSMLMPTVFAQKPNKIYRPGMANQEQVSPLPPVPPPPPVPPAPPAPDMSGLPVPPQLNLPDLTSDQVENIRKADLEHMKAMTPLKNQVRENNARLQTILTTSPFDAKAADKVAEELGKSESAIIKEIIRHDQALRNLLTSQQQIIFDARPKPFLHSRNSIDNRISMPPKSFQQ